MHSTSFNNPQLELQNVVVVLRFTAGGFNDEFSTTLEIYSNGKNVHLSRRQLPPAPDLPKIYGEWAKSYSRLGHLNMADFSSVPGQMTNHAMLGECLASAKELKDYISRWFSHDKFDSLSHRIQASKWVKQDRSVPIAFNFLTNDSEVNDLLRRLPWHLWQLFKDLDKAEVALSTGPQPNAETEIETEKSDEKVRILAIFGGDQEAEIIEGFPSEEKDDVGRGNLSLGEDKEALRKIVEPFNAKIKFLEQPGILELREHLIDPRGWDILFFSGHSTSDSEDGYLLIRKDHPVAISSLENELREALQYGLKLAIFNSCSGLGISNFFAGWSKESPFPNEAIPSIIVMKEPVPDFVARRFFREFLARFTGGESVYRAVRKARESLTVLHDHETPYPCADWLPVICLSPSQPELYWSRPRGKGVIKPPVDLKWVQRVGIVAIAGLVTWFAGGKIIDQFTNRTSKSIPIELVSGDDFSFGEEFLLGESRSAVAQAGVDSFRQGDYEEAIRHFLTALKSEPNDPEQLIYLNNAQAAISGKPVTTIAVSIPGTDAQADAKELLRGVAQFQAENNCGIEPLVEAIKSPMQLNCGGNAKALQVLIADHENRNDDQKILDRFEQIKADPRIIGLVGRYNSDMTFAVEDEIINDGITLPTISTTSTAVRDSAQPVSGYVFRTSPTDAATALKWNNYLESNGAEHVVILSDPDSVYSQSLRSELRNLMSQAVREQSYDCDLSSISTCLDETQGKLVDAIILAPSDKGDLINASLNFVDRYEARNEGQPIVLGGDTLYSYQQILNRISQGSLLEQLLVAVPWHRGQNPSRFEEEASALWGAKVSWRSAMAHDAAKLLFTANEEIASCENAETCRQAVKDTMVSKGLDDGATGTVRFSEDGNRVVGSSDKVSVLVGINLNERTFECLEGEFCAK